jgi:hypothetical protein
MDEGAATGLYFCLLCPDGDPWVGDYDVVDHIGECPRCRYSVGIFPVEEGGFPRDEPTRAAIAAVVKAGRVDRLDQEVVGRWCPDTCIPAPTLADSGWVECPRCGRERMSAGGRR